MEDETSDPKLWKKAGETAGGGGVRRPGAAESEPVLVSPWTMGRDKVSPKPLDHSGFATLCKGANDVLRRHAAALHARMHRSIYCTSEAGDRLRADLDIQPDQDDPPAH